METLKKHKKYKVHPEDPDVRGWDVVVNGTKLGTVDDLVLDTNNMTVKYLDIIRKDPTEKKDYHYLIPMDQVYFFRSDRQVQVQEDPGHFLNRYPRYSNDIPRDYEERVRKYYSERNPGRSQVQHGKYPESQHGKHPEDSEYTGESTETHTGQYPGRNPGWHEQNRITDEDRDERIQEGGSDERFRSSRTGVKGKEPVFGSEYENLRKKHPENLKERIDVLEKQKQSKQLKKIEMERDIAQINEEITMLSARKK